MIHSTYDVYVDFGCCQRYIPPLRLCNNGSGHHHSIAFHLFGYCFSRQVPAGYEIEAHWKNLDGIRGSYTQIDGVDAYSINGNVVTVKLPPEVINSASPVMFSIDIQTEDETRQLCTPPVLLDIAQFVPPPFDREKACCPYVNAMAWDSIQTDSGTTVEVTLSGINAAFVRGLALEYIKRPKKENEPVSIPIEIGEYDLVNGHIYTVTIPETADFEFRAVLNYVTPDGAEKTEESRWAYADCSKCGGMHSWEHA